MSKNHMPHSSLTSPMKLAHGHRDVWYYAQRYKHLQDRTCQKQERMQQRHLQFHSALPHSGCVTPHSGALVIRDCKWWRCKSIKTHRTTLRPCPLSSTLTSIFPVELARTYGVPVDGLNTEQLNEILSSWCFSQRSQTWNFMRHCTIILKYL